VTREVGSNRAVFDPWKKVVCPLRDSQALCYIVLKLKKNSHCLLNQKDNEGRVG
jgi:hypothetical protein